MIVSRVPHWLLLMRIVAGLRGPNVLHGLFRVRYHIPRVLY